VRWPIGLINEMLPAGKDSCEQGVMVPRWDNASSIASLAAGSGIPDATTLGF
jgi:hypothetical protein